MGVEGVQVVKLVQIGRLGAEVLGKKAKEKSKNISPPMTPCGDSFLWGGEYTRVLCLPRSALPIDLGPDATASTKLERTTNGNII